MTFILSSLKIVCTVIIISSCNKSHDKFPDEMIGTWALTNEYVHRLPPPCKNLRLEFTLDGQLITTSGEFKLVADASAKKDGNGYVVHQTIVEHNDKPNCQGKSAYFMTANFIHEVYFEKRGDTLRQYIWTKQSSLFIEFNRAERRISH